MIKKAILFTQTYNMHKFVQFFLVLTLSVLSANAFAKIYSYKGANGEIVFSNTKPSSTNYKSLTLRHENIIKNNFLQVPKKNLNYPTFTNKYKKVENKDLTRNNVTITHPNDYDIFTRYQTMQVTTDPILIAKDNPMFYLDNVELPGIYINRYWLIPTPVDDGINRLEINGTFHNGTTIHSNVAVFSKG